MPIDFRKVMEAAQGGLSVVCAACERYWEGQDKGLRGCTSQTGCGSPFAGRSFHEYKGPLANFASFCFVCGEESSRGVQVDGKVFGLCYRHASWLTQVTPKDVPVRPVLVVLDNGKVPIQRPTLPEAIQEVEAYYQAKEG